MEDDKFNVVHPSNFVLSIITAIIAVIGLPGNAFLAILILSSYKTRKPHEWLLFLLAINDFLACLNSVALEAPFITEFNSVECKAAGFLDYVFGTSSFLTPLLVAYNRYLSLYDSPRYKKLFTNRNIFFMWSVTTSLCVGWIIPFAVTGNLGQDDLGICGIQIRTTSLFIFYVFVYSVHGSSNGILMYYSFKVISKIRDHKKSVNVSNVQSRLIRESQELITVVLLLATIPVFATIPSATVKLLQTMLPPFNPWLSRILVSTFGLTSALNAYITLFVIKAYRRSVIKIFHGSVSGIGRIFKISSNRVTAN